jgi:hypothetical protein
VGDVFDPDVAAEAAFRAVRTGAREYWVGGSAIEAIVGQLVSPTVMDRHVADACWDPQISAAPEDPGRPDNLFEPAPGNQGARGRFGAVAKPRALILDPEKARICAALGMAVGAAVMAGLWIGRAVGHGRV